MVTNPEIDRFLADPVNYFGRSLDKIMGPTPSVVNELQIEGLRRRFAQLRGRLPMLDKLADLKEIHAIQALDDVLPLLFDHATYKSYPAMLIDSHRYRQLTSWLNKLTTIDLSGVDVSACRSIDDWMLTINRETPLALCHTSGTSGTISFVPSTKTDWRQQITLFTIYDLQRFGESSDSKKLPLNMDCIYPFFRSGGMSHTTMNDAIVELVAGDEARLHAAYPERLSSDLLLLATKRRAAAAAGKRDPVTLSPELAARRLEFEAQQRSMAGHLDAFFDTMRVKLAGRSVFMIVASHMLFTLAEKGLKQGLRNVFSPDSVVVSGGGGKGMTLPAHWQDTVKEFLGVDRIFLNYGMTEMSSILPDCEFGHYHLPPWIIPFVLDPSTKRPLARQGTVTGQFAFYDLMVDTRWGGFVSGDEVTMTWEGDCPCGRSTSYLSANIVRLSEKSESDGDEKLSCAATPAVYTEALDFLGQIEA